MSDKFSYSEFIKHIENINLEGLKEDLLPLTIRWNETLPPKEIVGSSIYFIETASRFNLCPLKHWDDGIKITYNELCFSITIPFQDQASVENAIQCLMFSFYIVFDVQESLMLFLTTENQNYNYHQ